MTQSLYESEYIYGIYEPGGEQHMLAAGRPGWILFSEALGHDPDDQSGVDFTPYSRRNLGIICRLNNGYEPEGTIPHSSQYEQFARRVANFVATSRGCRIWIIGNEMNYATERPNIVIDWSRHHRIKNGPPEEADPAGRGVSVRFNALPDNSTEIRTTRGAIVSPGEVITPELYARCYRLCRDAIHRLAGHENDLVLIGAVAPWNTQTIYPTNPNGDWIQYFRDILELLGSDNCDGFSLHTYTHGSDPKKITSTATLAPPFQDRHAEFRAYRDFMHAVPRNMRHLAAFITECDQTVAWANQDQGWVQSAYAEINDWNKTPNNQLVRALILYRWPRIDRWFIDGKQGVIDDFQTALLQGYRWQVLDSPERAYEPEPAQDDSISDYQVEWLDDRFPPKLLAGETIIVPIKIRNCGALTWNWGGGNPFRIGYRYYRNRRLLAMSADKDLRTDVPEDIAPGMETMVNVHIALPDEAGNFTLELDLVQEGITWFKEQGANVLTRWLTVETLGPAAEPEHNGAGAELPVPLFSDVTQDLPRSGVAYGRRSLDQIKFLVISHTATNPQIGLDRIAEAHVKNGYPGIAYDFMVDREGQIYRVSDLETAAEPSQLWSLQGVNIGLAGNFSAAAPPLSQLDATGRLCAWLAQNLNLSPESIVGLGQLTKTESPGRTFYSGPHWQELLQRQVQLHLAVLQSGAEQIRDEQIKSRLEDLSQENEELRSRVTEVSEQRQSLQAFNDRLQAETAELRQQLLAQSQLPDDRPPMRDMIHQLPRDPGRYVLRSADAVRYIVINHTGASPGLPLHRLAEAHMPDWPGVLYDFYIDDHGAIFQTQPMDEVADTELPYVAQAINVAFAGTFDDRIPSREQLYAGGQLIAWLLSRFPRADIDAIKGMGEFTSQDSPGRLWLEGAAWKETLVASVRRASGLIDPSAVESDLRTQLAETGKELQVALRNSQLLEQQRRRLQSENQQLQTELAVQSNLGKGYLVPMPAIRDLTKQLPRHPTLRYERRARNQITHIAIHHTATLSTVGPMRIAEMHIAEDASRGKEAWPGIGYHFFVHADGTIDKLNDLETVSYHVYQHNSYAVGIAFAGSFMNGKVPTSAQMRSGAHLSAWLMQELEIPLARVWGHREYADNLTVCPGSEWRGGRRWRDMLYEGIERVQSGTGIKSIRHYLLFWERAYPGPMARQDFVNAIGYVSRFRPTIGFSVDDARNAEYVTVVGTEAGIDAATESILRKSGCKVERIAGRTEEETSRMLGELVRLDRRFRTFEVDF